MENSLAGFAILAFLSFAGENAYICIERRLDIVFQIQVGEGDTAKNCSTSRF